MRGFSRVGTCCIPGWSWALKCQARQETPATIQSEVLAYLQGRAFEAPARLFQA